MSKVVSKASGRRTDPASVAASRPEQNDGRHVVTDRWAATASQADLDMMALIAGVAPAKAPRRSAADSAGLLDRLLGSWQILATLPVAVLEQDLAQVMAKDDHLRLRHAYLAVVAFEKAQIAGCRGFLNALRQAGIRHALLKGAASACFLYPERWMRAAWDFDVGVAWADLEAAERLALAAGFHQAQRDPEIPRFYRADRELRAIVEESHFELGFLVRRLQPTNLDGDTRAAIAAEPWTHQFWHDAASTTPWCYAVVDIHHKLSLDIELDGLLGSVRQVVSGGETVSVPDLAWSTAHLIYKLYWEGVHKYGKGLYQYADLIRLMPLLDAAAFARAVEILQSYQLVAGGYYCLKHLADFGVALPDFVVAFLDAAAEPPADADAVDINDLGDVWPKLWGRR